jgi:hypothetical protein
MKKMKLNKILLAIIFIILIGIVSAEPVPKYGAVVVRDEVTYGLLDPSTNMVNQVPDPVEPGGYVEVRFKVENIGAHVVENLVFELIPQYPFSLNPGTKAIQRIGEIYMYQTGDEAYVIYYKLRVDKDAIEGDNPIKVRYSVDSGLTWTSKEFHIRVQTQDAMVSIEDVILEPEQIAPGKEAELTLTIQNNEDTLIKDIRVNLGILTKIVTTTVTTSELPITPVGSTNEKTIRNIGAHQSNNVTFNLIADPDAESTIYKLPITISYIDNAGTNYSKIYYTSIVVGEKPDLTTVIEESEIITSGKTGEVSLRFTNKGASDVKFLYVELLKSENYEILSQPNVYIGNIDSDDYESAEFNLHVKGTRDKAIQLPLRIEYRDSNNNEFKKDTILNLRLYSGAEAKRYGLIPASNPLKSILFIVIVLWGIWFYYKKKKNKDLLKISIEKLKILKQKLKRKK